MSRLVSAEDFIARGAAASTSASNISVANSVLDGATRVIGSILGTTFDRHVVKDYYTVKTNSDSTFRIRTSKGHIDAGESLTIHKANTYSYAEDITDSVVVSDTLYHVVSHEKGIIEIDFTPPYSRLSFFVTYTCGFEVDTDVFQDTPDWLKEACIVYGLNMQKAQSFTVKSNEGSAKPNVPLNAMARNAIDPYIRPIMGLKSPTKTVVVS